MILHFLSAILGDNAIDRHKSRISSTEICRIAPDGTTVNISDSKITTTKNNSGGIMTTGGGVMNATNLTINTAGTSSAAIRSDRGGGTVTVNKGTYKTTGKGSPTIYSTADITVKNAKLISTSSEGVVTEGKNSINLENVELTDTNNTLNGQSTTYKNIFIYQSMSGDADTGTATFSSKDSTITTNKGDTIYVTNTKASITLENNTFINNDSEGNFLKCSCDYFGESECYGNIEHTSLDELYVKMKDILEGEEKPEACIRCIKSQSNVFFNELSKLKDNMIERD